MNYSSQQLLRLLPPVNDLLTHDAVSSFVERQGREIVTEWIRAELTRVREQITENIATEYTNVSDRGSMLNAVAERVAEAASEHEQTRIGEVINATGVVLHTGLGRAPMSSAAKQAMESAAGATNVEIDLASGQRRYRGHQLQELFRQLTGAEDCVIVNNNAAATLLTLQALCSGREVVISRGQLIEIGGSFRLPDIFELSGARLREVGTSNRTRLSDYAKAIGPETAAVMHVHTSNYKVIGFTESVRAAELATLAKECGVHFIDDIGSGALIDLQPYGLPTEPTFPESVQSGADIVLGSGDKLLGGPQAGIILGTADLIEMIRSHQLARAMRVDKLTLAALSATLESYLRGNEIDEIPTLCMLTMSPEQIAVRANRLRESLGQLSSLTVEMHDDLATVGGGSMPGVELKTTVLSLSHKTKSASELSRAFRLGEIRVMGRVQENRLLLDLRSLLPEYDEHLAGAIRRIDTVL